jgi:uncharacterized protein DUF3306
MTSPDKPDQDKGFLARWSQRKQEAKQPEPKQDAPAVASDAPSAPVAEVEAEPEFDLSSLPKLEELTETTDITAFLKKGVPENVRNAALRKSWALDPAIRNYVNPALDYAYDWNTPGGVPGNGEIGAGVDIARMVSQIMGGESLKEPSNSATDPAIEGGSVPAASAEPDPSPEPQQELPIRSVRLGEKADFPEGCNVEVGQAAQSEAVNPLAPQQQVRRHGTAKPIV